MKFMNWPDCNDFRFKKYSFVNLYSYLELRSRSDLDDIVFMSDGFLMCIISKFFGKNVKRFSFDMTSLAPVIFSKGGYKFAIVGSTNENIEIFSDFLGKRFDVRPCFVSSGYFEGDGNELCHKIVHSGADITVVGLGTPLQEEFILKLTEAGYKGIAFTCGGFITQTASAGGEYYPRLIDKYNLRFLYRMYKEPHTVRRYLFLYPKGVLFFVYDLFMRRHEFVGESC